MAETKTPISNAAKKDIARELYLKGEHTQKEIAAKLGVSEQTMVQWVKAGEWDAMRETLTSSKAKRLRELYEELAYIYRRNKEAREDDDPETNPNYDDYAKVSAVIARLEKDAGEGDVIRTALSMIDFVEREDMDAAKIVSHWALLFVQDKMRESK